MIIIMKVDSSRVFAKQQVGIKEREDNIRVVSFLDYDLGYFNNKCMKSRAGKRPFWYRTPALAFFLEQRIKAIDKKKISQ